VGGDVPPSIRPPFQILISCDLLYCALNFALGVASCSHFSSFTLLQAPVDNHFSFRLFLSVHMFNFQILVGNKVDMAPEKRAVSYARGKALADEYRIQFFETSAKSNTNVDEVRLGVHISRIDMSSLPLSDVGQHSDPLTMVWLSLGERCSRVRLLIPRRRCPSVHQSINQ
jgi:hypothetical protein